MLDKCVNKTGVCGFICVVLLRHHLLLRDCLGVRGENSLPELWVPVLAHWSCHLPRIRGFLMPRARNCWDYLRLPVAMSYVRDAFHDCQVPQVRCLGPLQTLYQHQIGTTKWYGGDGGNKSCGLLFWCVYYYFCSSFKSNCFSVGIKYLFYILTKISVYYYYYFPKPCGIKRPTTKNYEAFANITHLMI